MSLSRGARLGPYTIGSLLGAGGMGEVYRARDGKLNRDVAIKVLRSDVVGDRERLARFEREARVLAALNHPNIANVIGLEDAGGTPALVMELVDGPTLALRIDEGPLPLEEAFEIARQIAEALEAAHDRGIVHRDLKPANVKVRPDGIVKVLDFGLAKALDPFDPQGVSDQANSPTITSPAMTMRGVILGTAAYMSPEQAKGRPVDRRADLWGCGCVLYEMLTGRRAFEGEDTTETIAAVVTKEPDWTALPPATPASIRRLLQRLLAKNPKQRLDSAVAVRLELADAAPPEPRDPDGASPARPSRRSMAVTAATVGVLTAAAASLATWSAVARPASTPSPVTRFEITLPATHPLAISFNARDIALSPDGTHLAYTAGLQSQLVVRALDQLESVPLQGITGARAPFFSPDGRWIGYFDQGGEMRRVAVDGGRPTTMAKVDGTSRGASWDSDDVIVFATSNSRGLMTVPASGGEPSRLTAVAADELDHYYPAVLPQDRGVLYTRRPADGPPSVMLRDPDGVSHLLLRDASQAEFVDGGFLVYASAETMWGTRFSPEARQVTGAPFRLFEDAVGLAQTAIAANAAVSARGTIAYARPPRVAERSLAWMGRTGVETAIPVTIRTYHSPRLSRDGRQLAVVIEDGDNWDLWTWDLTGAAAQTLRRLTFEPLTDAYPVWAAGGGILHGSMRGQWQDIYRRRPDRSGLEERLTTGPSNKRPLAVSPDGRTLVFEENSIDAAWNLMRLVLDGASSPEPLLRSRYDERNADLSPDGRWIAYESNETGQIEIYVRPFPNVNDAVFQVSAGGGRTPAWSPAGGELFYVNGSGLYAVPVTLTPAVAYGSPVLLFEAPSVIFDARPVRNGAAHRMYDVARDGQRFVVVRAAGGEHVATRHSLVVVQHVFEHFATLTR
jgi:serine/threonine protein kinase